MLEGPTDEPPVDRRATSCRRNVNRVTTPRFATRASERPEQVRVLMLAGGPDLAVRGDDFDLSRLSTVQTNRRVR